MLDKVFLTQVRDIDWFSSSGRDFSVEVPIPLLRIESWQEAGQMIAAPLCKDAMEEAQGRLTAFLHATDRARHRHWNEIVRSVKADLVLPLTEEVWQPFSVGKGLSPTLEHSVQQNVLGAIMEHEYRDIPGLPIFFTHLLSIFRAGHLPCGWTDAEYPKGRLCVL